MKKKSIVLIVTGLLIMCSASYAANYKFDVNIDTSSSGKAGYSSYAYKYSTDEDAVLKVYAMDNNWDANIQVVNSDDDQRSEIVTVKTAPWEGVLDNLGMTQNHKYRLKVEEVKQTSHSYNIRGWWNPDTY